MLSQTIYKLDQICASFPSRFNLIPDQIWTDKSDVNKWSKKQILGHLIDSATNNHHRFIRAQLEDTPDIRYDQDLWNKSGFYQEIPVGQLIQFWLSYNLQIIELLRHLSADSLKRTVKMGETIRNLEELAADYVLHLEHHLNQIIEI